MLRFVNRCVLKPYVRFNSTSVIYNNNTHEDYRLRSALEKITIKLASYPLPQTTLNDLLRFNSKVINKDTDQMILDNANDTLKDMLALTAKRIRELRSLPYICVLNANIGTIYDTYLESLQLLLKFISDIDGDIKLESIQDFTIKDTAHNVEFNRTLNQITELHADNLEILSKGFEEIAHLRVLKDDRDFLDSHLKERILMRLICNHHVALSEQLVSKEKSNLIGVVEKNLDVIEIVNRSFDFVNDMCLLKYDEKISMEIDTVILQDDIRIESHNNDHVNSSPIHFPYISSHLQYIITELLKNSARAHIENHVTEPINVTIVANKPYVCNKVGDCHVSNYLEIRIRDLGKGITPEVFDKIFEYSYTTFVANEGEAYKTLNNSGPNANVISGMGYGMPLSKIYVELFGGDINVQTYLGWGTDVYVKLTGPDMDLVT
ncbi:BA75_01239T0 [Komagataella pastoris]|uniref:Protein-serine/threonine kinase n=1 Tax=Komagataella pastoris TaxID=4922 RepID=A0A1B2J9W9_PICPA|nr:BA75_01239T0 [Komagataella pastoris]